MNYFLHATVIEIASRLFLAIGKSVMAEVAFGTYTR